MADPIGKLTKAPTEMLAGAMNFKIVGGVVVGVALGTVATGLLFKYFSDKKIVKDVQSGLNG